jgi:diguanylate cyclase (GGDEF)-like protein/PAS domain S-box-containing protein
MDPTTGERDWAGMKFAIPGVATLAAAVWLAGRWHWSSRVPFVVMFGVLVVSAVASTALATFGQDSPAWQRHLRVASVLGTCTVAMYLTGWGPLLSVGYLYLVAQLLEDQGSRATGPIMAWLTVCSAIGLGAVALHIAPTMLHRPLVYGLGTLTTVGLLSGVRLLGASAARSEAAEEARRGSDVRFRSVLAHSTDFVAVIGADGVISYQSPSVEKLLGHKPDKITTFLDTIHPDDHGQAGELFATILTSPGATITGEIRLLHADGTARLCDFSATNLLDTPGVNGVVANVRDITERRASEDELKERAFRDALTGLPNRALFMDRLDQALTHLERHAGPMSVLFLDLDRFKVVNDSLGHSVGDELLVMVARRIEQCVREGDTVARLGGDEFTVLLDGMDDPSDAIHVADRIVAMCRLPFVVDGREVFTTASIGIVMCEPGQAADDVLRSADLAMYLAKDSGRSRHATFDASMSARAVAQLETETDLRRAITRGHLMLHYQPLVRVDTSEIVGLEALVRWPVGDHLVSPSEFIPMAEETGLIVPLGRWVLEEACRQGEAWRAEGLLGPDTTMNVNISARQLAQPDLVATVAEVLGLTGFPVRQLVLEITESDMMRDFHDILGTLRRLERLGVGLAIDDFGAGYSSFGYLRRFPAQTLKLDKTFIDGVSGRRQADTAIVETVVRLAHTLDMKVIAEGVETPEQLAGLIATGCDLFQGYQFSRPLPAHEMRSLLAPTTALA